MLTTVSEAEEMEDKTKEIASLATKEQPEELVPEIPADLIFLDSTNLIASVAETLKPAGFLLLHAESEPPAETPGLDLIASKILADKTMALYRKVRKFFFLNCKLTFAPKLTISPLPLSFLTSCNHRSSPSLAQ